MQLFCSSIILLIQNGKIRNEYVKEIWCRNNLYVYIFVAATILNWQMERAKKMEDYLPPRNVKKECCQVSSRIKKEWQKLYLMSSVEYSPGEFNCTVCDHIVWCFHQGEADVNSQIQGALIRGNSMKFKFNEDASQLWFKTKWWQDQDQVSKLCYIAIGIYLQYKDCLLITLFYLLYKLFYV